MKKQKEHMAPAPPNFAADSNEMLALFARLARPLRLDALLRVADLPRRSKKDMEALLAGLVSQGRLLRLRGGLWALPESLKTLTGRFSALRNGAGGGFVTPQDATGAPLAGRDIFIPPAQSNAAWHQDVVRVALAPRRGPGKGPKGTGEGKSPEGRILEVLERTLTEVPAHVTGRTGRRVFCRPADSRLPVEFSLELPPDAPLPEQGALLLLAPERALASNLWSARLLSAFGREDDVAVQEELVKLNHEAPRDFPPAALAKAAALPLAPTAADLQGREDLRHLPLVTIDGADARDFDDAVHVEPLPGGGWLLRVAIADVSHYVRPRGQGHGALDAEALTRGNSWYFPTSVEPMLPAVLSNGLCSLVPHQDRLAVLAEISFSRQGLPGRARFAAAVMRSAARLTYDQVKACLLDKGSVALDALRAQEQGPEVLAMLETAFALYHALREQRRARGSLDFDLPEPSYAFDAQGRLTAMTRRERHGAHRLIEECMIAANEAVARHLRDTGLPFLYRVHPRPEPERLDSLFASLAATTVENLPAGQLSADALQGILATASGTPQDFLVGRLCLRAMPQARYQPMNDGHFGLASEAYCHFTSPIRRYADLLVHRALKSSLGQDVGPLPAGQKLLRIGDQINRRERAAIDAEREMARRLACLALRGKEGQRFSGVVSGLMEFGLFVELEALPVEGMIRVEDLGGDWYDFDPKRQCLLGQRFGLRWHLGQHLDVLLNDVNLGRLEIRLTPAVLPLPEKGAVAGRRPLRRNQRGRNDKGHAAPGRQGQSAARSGPASKGNNANRGKPGKAGKGGTARPARRGTRKG